MTNNIFHSHHSGKTPWAVDDIFFYFPFGRTFRERAFSRAIAGEKRLLMKKDRQRSILLKSPGNNRHVFRFFHQCIVN